MDKPWKIRRFCLFDSFESFLEINEQINFVKFRMSMIIKVADSVYISMGKTETRTQEKKTQQNKRNKHRIIVDITH